MQKPHPSRKSSAIGQKRHWQKQPTKPASLKTALLADNLAKEPDPFF